MKGETTKENIAKMVADIFKENGIAVDTDMRERISKNPFIVCGTLVEIIHDMKRKGGDPMEYPMCAIRRPLKNETTSQFRARRYELYKVLHKPLDDKAKADIETEINQLIMQKALIIDD